MSSPLRCSIALDNSFVTLICNVLTDAILVVGDKDTLAVAAVLSVELHGGVEGGAGAAKKSRTVLAGTTLRRVFIICVGFG